MFKLSIAASKLLKSSVSCSKELLDERVLSKDLFVKSGWRYADHPAICRKVLDAMQKSISSCEVKNLLSSNVPYSSIFKAERAMVFFDALFDESAFKTNSIEEINGYAVELLEILDDIAKSGSAEFVFNALDDEDNTLLCIADYSVPKQLKHVFAEAGCFTDEEKLVALQTLIQFISEFDYLTKNYTLWCQVAAEMIAQDMSNINRDAFGNVVEKTACFITSNDLTSSHQISAIVSIAFSAAQVKNP